MCCQISSIVSDTEENSRSSVVQPGQSYKVQAWVSGDSTLLDGISVWIDDWQLNKAEIKSVSRGPHNSGNSLPLQVQFCHLFLLITIKQSRDVLGRSGQPDTADVIVDLL